MKLFSTWRFDRNYDNGISCMASEFNSERQTILRKVTDKKERLRNTTRKEEGKENEKDRTRKTRVRGVGKKGKYGEIMKLKTVSTGFQ